MPLKEGQYIPSSIQFSPHKDSLQVKIRTPGYPHHLQQEVGNEKELASFSNIQIPE